MQKSTKYESLCDLPATFQTKPKLRYPVAMAESEPPDKKTRITKEEAKQAKKDAKKAEEEKAQQEEKAKKEHNETIQSCIRDAEEDKNQRELDETLRLCVRDAEEAKQKRHSQRLAANLPGASKPKLF